MPRAGWLIVVVALGACAHRRPRAPADGVADARVFYYRDNEGLQVVTSGAHVEQALPHGDTLQVSYVMDHVEIHPVDAVSRASAQIGDGLGLDKNRYELTAGYLADVSGARATAHVGARARVSIEPDYLSASGELRYAGELNRGNTAIAASVTYGHDRIDPKLFHPDDAGRWPAAHDRVTATIAVRQLLGARTDVSFGVGGGVQLGALQSPYRRASVLEGFGAFASYHDHAERHPGTRGRFTGFLGVSRYLGRGAALHLRLGGYADTWRVLALTPEVAVVFELGRRVLLSLGYRYYVQSSASFYQPKYASLTALRSGDRRLGALDEHVPGVELRWTIVGEPARAGALEVVASYQLSRLRYWRIDTAVLSHQPSLGLAFVH